MRKLLLWVDASFATLCLTMALCQGVVCILYLFVLDLSPTLRHEMPALVGSTFIFLFMGLAFLAVFVVLLRQRAWRWPLQSLVLVALMPAYLILYRLLTDS